MSNAVRRIDAGRVHSTQFDELLTRVTAAVIEGLEHGHFEVSVVEKIGSNNRREVVINSAQSHKLTIRSNDLPD